LYATLCHYKPEKRVVLLLCSERYIYAIILSAFLILSPLPLHADGPFSLPVNSNEKISPDQEKPLTPVPAVKSQYPVILPPMFPAKTVVTIPSPVLSMPLRAVAPFAPALRIGSTVISEDSQWNGAIQVDGTVTVAPQATLTILPGTVVRFAADSGLLVLGRVVAKGSPAELIILTSLYLEPLASDWHGIVMTGTSKKNLLEYLKIEGAETGIYARFSSVELKNLRVEKSLVAIKLVDSIAYLKDTLVSGCSTGLSAFKSEVDIDSTAFENGGNGISVALSSLTADKLKILSSSQSAFTAEKSQLKIEKSVFSGNSNGVRVTGCSGGFNNSKFTYNSEAGAVLSGSSFKFSSNLVYGNKVGIQLEDDLPSVWGNSIQGNSSYNILYLGDEKIYAGGNWFGTASGESLNKTLFSKHPGALRILPVLASEPLNDSPKDF
jgi:hypothetical protein